MNRTLKTAALALAAAALLTGAANSCSGGTSYTPTPHGHVSATRTWTEGGTRHYQLTIKTGVTRTRITVTRAVYDACRKTRPIPTGGWEHPVYPDCARR